MPALFTSLIDVPPHQLPAAVAMQPVGPVHGTIRPPGSKSITNRALVCAALARGTSTLTGVLDSDDTRLMLGALDQLGFAPQVDWSTHTVTIAGHGGNIPAAAAELFIGNSGTTARFLAAMLALGNGRYVIDGTKRMRERPIQDLLDALVQLGTNARSTSGTGCPPLEILASGLPGGTVSVRGDMSSQFLSGLLLAAPAAKAPLTVAVSGTLVSVPYVEMTCAVLEAFGAKVAIDRDAAGVPQQMHVANSGYVARDYAIEPDASAASYFFAAAAITGGEVTVAGLTRTSLQGDVELVAALERMGCTVSWQPDAITVGGGPLRGIEIDMNAISDTVMTLAAVAVFATGPTTITGVGHIRHKETDRITALATELRRLGAEVEEWTDGLRITPAPLHSAEIHTYDDHRMAMSLALVGLRIPGVVILDPQCTAKTYPLYFADLARLTQGN